MAKLELDIKSDISHIELHLVVKTSFGINRPTEFTTQWLENITIEQFEKMVELYEAYKSNSTPPQMDEQKFAKGSEMMSHIKGGGEGSRTANSYRNSRI